ncbi:MAG: hypothetical protein KAT37_03325, partial [Candidatus Aenigmarchaeota archaeon]|nr:hypothetical protein [Candidatus Aenigmarchaeota archaeon]
LYDQNGGPGEIFTPPSVLRARFLKGCFEPESSAIFYHRAYALNPFELKIERPTSLTELDYGSYFQRTT